MGLLMTPISKSVLEILAAIRLGYTNPLATAGCSSRHRHHPRQHQQRRQTSNANQTDARPAVSPQFRCQTTTPYPPGAICRRSSAVPFQLECPSTRRSSAPVNQTLAMAFLARMPAAAPQAPSPMFTTIDRPNADVAGGPSVAGQLAPQYFNRAREPGGPAQMGALDLSGLFNHPAVAAQAAAHPMVQAAARAPVQGPLSALAPQRAPMAQASPFVYPRTNAPSPSKDINAVPLRKSYNPFQLFGTPT